MRGEDNRRLYEGSPRRQLIELRLSCMNFMIVELF